MSLLEAMGLPSQFGITLLLFFFILTMVPIFAGKDFGVLKIPEFEDPTKRRLRRLAPILLIGVVLLHLPILPPHGSARGESEEKNSKIRNGASSRVEPGQQDMETRPKEQEIAREPTPDSGPSPNHQESSQPPPSGSSSPSLRPKDAIIDKSRGAEEEMAGLMYSHVVSGRVEFQDGAVDELLSSSTDYFASTRELSLVNKSYRNIQFKRISEMNIYNLTTSEEAQVPSFLSRIIVRVEIQYRDGTQEIVYGPGGGLIQTRKFGSNNILGARKITFN